MEPHQQHFAIHHRITCDPELDVFARQHGRLAGDPDWGRGEAPPRGWQRATPRYKATRDLHPPALVRMGLETPWASCNNESVWQYAPGLVHEGEEVVTTSWPHESLRLLNESAKRIHHFFTTATKSRMQMRPWADGHINIDDGMSIGDPLMKRSA